MRSRLAVLAFALVSCGSPAPHRAPARDGGPHRTKLPADGGLFVDRDHGEEELGRAILQDMDRLVPPPTLHATEVTIGEAYPYRFEFTPDEIPPGDRALAIPVTLHAAASGITPGQIVLATDQGERLGAEPIVEWLDEGGTRIVQAPVDPGPTAERPLLLVYFAPRAMTSGSLWHRQTRLGDVHLGAPGPVRPRSMCRLAGAFGYAPIPRKLLLEIRVQDVFARWTPLETSVGSADVNSADPPARCLGFRRLDPRGKLLPLGTVPPGDEVFVDEARFLAVYDLEAARGAELSWDGTDCEATALPERTPLPRRLGPDNGPPPLEGPAE